MAWYDEFLKKINDPWLKVGPEKSPYSVLPGRDPNDPLDSFFRDTVGNSLGRIGLMPGYRPEAMAASPSPDVRAIRDPKATEPWGTPPPLAPSHGATYTRPKRQAISEPGNQPTPYRAIGDPKDQTRTPESEWGDYWQKTAGFRPEGGMTPRMNPQTGMWEQGGTKPPSAIKEPPKEEEFYAKNKQGGGFERVFYDPTIKGYVSQAREAAEIGAPPPASYSNTGDMVFKKNPDGTFSAISKQKYGNPKFPAGSADWAPAHSGYVYDQGQDRWLPRPQERAIDEARPSMYLMTEGGGLRPTGSINEFNAVTGAPSRTGIPEGPVEVIQGAGSQGQGRMQFDRGKTGFMENVTPWEQQFRNLYAKTEAEKAIEETKGEQARMTENVKGPWDVEKEKVRVEGLLKIAKEHNIGAKELAQLTNKLQSEVGKKPVWEMANDIMKSLAPKFVDPITGQMTPEGQKSVMEFSYKWAAMMDLMRKRGAQKEGEAPVEGAKLGPDGKWYIPDPARPGKYMIVEPEDIPKRALGGPVEEDEPYLVGEQGPELFVPGQDGNVLPNPTTEAINMRFSPVETPEQSPYQFGTPGQRRPRVPPTNPNYSPSMFGKGFMNRGPVGQMLQDSILKRGVW